MRNLWKEETANHRKDVTDLETQKQAADARLIQMTHERDDRAKKLAELNTKWDTESACFVRKIKGLESKIQHVTAERDSQARKLADLQNYMKVESAKATTKIDELESTKRELAKANMATQTELAELKTRLAESEAERQELLDHIANDNTPPTGHNSKTRARGLFLYDDVVCKLTDMLPKAGFDWKSYEIDLHNLNDLNPAEVQRADVMIILTGASAISKGTKGLDAFAVLSDFLDSVGQTTTTYIPNLIPSSRATSTQTSLFNHKLSKTHHGINIVTYNTPVLSALWDEQGKLAAKTISILADALSKSIKVPEINKCDVSPMTITDSGAQYQLFKCVDAKDIGRVIGSKGFT
jgi:hypothetical protein